MSHPTNDVGLQAEEILLETVSGSGKTADFPGGARRGAVISYCRDSDHRKLAISSIICGLSCLGIMSLIYSVKAEARRQADPEDPKAKLYTNKARKWGVAAILTWVAILVFTPLLLGLVSYLLTFID